MISYRILLCAGAVLGLLCAVPGAYAADATATKALPLSSCTSGWDLDGAVTLFDRDSLFDRINGESELFFPYGFEVLAYARYANRQNPNIAIDADIYSMGSLLDAFGIFANYRKKDDVDLAVGVEGTISDSQVFWYQDRYFVRLQVTGATSAPPDAFRACAQAISRNLPKAGARPQELEPFTVPAVVKKSERYVAQSLLGYPFFRRGVIADALVNKEIVQVFSVTDATPDESLKTMENYQAYLQTAGVIPRLSNVRDKSTLEAIDPLFGNVLIEQSGRIIIGAVRVKDRARVQQLIEQMRARTAAR